MNAELTLLVVGGKWVIRIPSLRLGFNNWGFRLWEHSLLLYWTKGEFAEWLESLRDGSDSKNGFYLVFTFQEEHISYYFLTYSFMLEFLQRFLPGISFRIPSLINFKIFVLKLLEPFLKACFPIISSLFSTGFLVSELHPAFFRDSFWYFFGDISEIISLLLYGIPLNFFSRNFFRNSSSISFKNCRRDSIRVSSLDSFRDSTTWKS